MGARWPAGPLPGAGRAHIAERSAADQRADLWHACMGGPLHGAAEGGALASDASDRVCAHGRRRPQDNADAGLRVQSRRDERYVMYPLERSSREDAAHIRTAGHPYRLGLRGGCRDGSGPRQLGERIRAHFRRSCGVCRPSWRSSSTG